MAKCAFCSTTILFGGVTAQGNRYCSKDHAARGALVIASNAIPENLVAEQARLVHSGRCPLCKGPGPVEIHNSYRVWSALLLTRWWTNTRMSCRRCARLANLRDGVVSLVLGWWGFPWGLLVTPMQVFRNIGAAVSTNDIGSGPSPQLARVVRFELASRSRGGPAGPT